MQSALPQKPLVRSSLSSFGVRCGRAPAIHSQERVSGRGAEAKNRNTGKPHRCPPNVRPASKRHGISALDEVVGGDRDQDGGGEGGRRHFRGAALRDTGDEGSTSAAAMNDMPKTPSARNPSGPRKRRWRSRR